jgi:LysM repeat protein
MASMAEQLKQPSAARVFLMRAPVIVLTAFVIGLGLGLILAGEDGGNAPDKADTGLDLPLLSVNVSYQPLDQPNPAATGPAAEAPATAPAPATPSGPAPAVIPPVESTSPPVESTSPPVSYQIQGGDTLTIIAARFGVSVQSLIDVNQLTQPFTFQAGQVLIIPHS